MSEEPKYPPTAAGAAPWDTIEPKYPPTAAGTPWEPTFEERYARRCADVAAGRWPDLEDLRREMAEMNAHVEGIKEKRRRDLEEEAEFQASLAAKKAERESD